MPAARGSDEGVAHLLIHGALLAVFQARFLVLHHRHFITDVGDDKALCVDA